MFDSDQSPIKITSSAYMRWDRDVPSLEILIPLNKPTETAFFIIPDNASITITNKKGDSGSPCRKPREQSNSLVGDPFTNTDALADCKVAITHPLHLLGNFIWAIIESKKAQFTESYALFISTLKYIPFLLFFFAQLRISLSTNGPSIMFLPAKNADWCSEIKFPRIPLIRFTSTLEIILLTTPIRLIGLKLAGLTGSLIFGMRAINEEVQLLLSEPSS
ncbi:hypothetical protein HanIR_Chr12g0605991 [Helianthus annuus]|nr:hypothetical protein HanIR_Chr12g0605991 [Helianthus annuus]